MAFSTDQSWNILKSWYTGGGPERKFGTGSLSKAKIILFLKMHSSCEYMTLKYPARKPQGQSPELITQLVVSHVNNNNYDKASFRWPDHKASEMLNA